jgi:uncharacterized protein YwqG
METAEILRLLQPWKDKHARPSWKPIVQSGNGHFTSSKFSGMPWMAENDSWPLCKACHEPLQLFLQVNRVDLPQPLLGKFGDGLLQLFYCTGDINGTCDVPDGWQPFSNISNLTRIVKPIGYTLESSIPKAHGYLPAKTIID